MTEQWIALGLTATLAIIGIISSLYQSSQAKQASLTMRDISIAAERTRADLATMKIDIIDRVDARLQDFARQATIRDYTETHGKEHLRLEQELTRLRDWRHTTDLLLREISAKISEMSSLQTEAVQEREILKSLVKNLQLQQTTK